MARALDLLWQTLIGPFIYLYRGGRYELGLLFSSIPGGHIHALTPNSRTRAIAITKTMEIKGRVVVYSIVGCPHCMKAKSTLQDLSVPYVDVNLETFPDVREDVYKRTGKRTVPQIFFNANHIGGNDELQKLVKNKEEFEKYLEDVKNNPAPAGAPVPPDPATAIDAGESGFVCEPDEYARLVQDLKASGLIKDHKQGLRVHKQSFKGSDFVDWVVNTKKLDRAKGKEMGQLLIDRHFGHNVKDGETFQDDNSYYRLLEDDNSSALNAGPLSECEPRPAGQLGEDIRKLILKIYSAFLSADGKKVDYRGISGSAEFERYVKLTTELQRVDIAGSSREEKLSFFINIYNALVIHANIVRGPPSNLWQRYKFFNTMQYIIGGQVYSLQDVENGVLRANRKGVGMLSCPFGKHDPRLKVALERHEPLIHFALVCGAKSCPPIKTYSSEGIYEQLDLAARSFIEGEDGLQINMEKKVVMPSRIFKWYRQDFGHNNGELVEWIHTHMDEGEKKDQLGQLLAGKKYSVSFLPYDWGINS